MPLKRVLDADYVLITRHIRIRFENSWGRSHLLADPASEDGYRSATRQLWLSRSASRVFGHSSNRNSFLTSSYSSCSSVSLCSDPLVLLGILQGMNLLPWMPFCLKNKCTWTDRKTVITITETKKLVCYLLNARQIEPHRKWVTCTGSQN